MKEEAVRLLQEIIEIPSYVDPVQQVNETVLVNYLENWAQENLECLIEKQPLGKDRYNLILKKGKPDTLFLAHTDTVAPSNSSQLQATVRDNAIWGRGAADMKSGLAALLLAAKNTPSAHNYWIVLYADEEYDFLGMKGFLDAYPNLQPKRIISADGSDLRVGFACRGLIELRLRFYGQSGHAAKGSGRNAIMGAYEVIATLMNDLAKQTSPELGKTSCNLAYVLGGQSQERAIETSLLQLESVGQAGNIIPDVCECVLDIRPATSEVTVDFVLQKVQQLAQQNMLRCELIDVVHDYSAWITPQSQVSKMLPAEIVQEWSNPQATGYLDLEMMWRQYGQPTACMFGGGVGATAHSATEHIPIADYLKTITFFTTCMEDLCR